MPAWDPFVAVTLLTLGLLLILARLSQNTIEEYAPDPSESEPSAESGSGRPSPGQPADSPVPDEAAELRPIESTSDAPADSPIRPPASSAGDSQQRHPRIEGESEIAHRKQDEPEIVLTPKVLLGNVALTQGLVVLVLLGAAWYFDIPAEAFGVTADAISTGLPAVAVGLGFGVVLWIANELSTTLADAVGASYDERVREMLAPETPGGWLVLFGGVLPLIAFAEELLFRAALIGVPEAAYGLNVWVLAVASSLAFALGHGAQGRVGVVVTGALGLVLAAGYILTGSLLVVVVAHYVINALEFLVHELLDLDGLSGLVSTAA